MEKDTAGACQKDRSQYLSDENKYLVCLSLSVVSAPRSLPARSINDNFPTSFVFLASLASRSLCLLVSVTGICFFTANCRMAWDRDDSSLAPVDPVLLEAFPLSMYSLTIRTSETSNSCKPTMQTCFFPSSLMQSGLEKHRKNAAQIQPQNQVKGRRSPIKHTKTSHKRQVTEVYVKSKVSFQCWI